MWGLAFSQLKKMLVRDGRSSRQDFLLAGVLPLWLVLIGLLAAPKIPVLGELGFILFIAVVFFSRAALAQAIRRAHDLGFPEDVLKSPTRQIAAYGQAFLLFMMASVIQQMSVSSNATLALVSSAAVAGGIVVALLGGPKIFKVLALDAARRPTSLAEILEMEAAAPRPQHPVTASHPTPRPQPAPPLGYARRPAPGTLPQPASEPRAVRASVKVSASPRPAPAPASAAIVRPVVRNRPRGAIGEWGPPGKR